ncbi:ribosomal protein L1/ribosomal biogenesis protein, partial [Coemansia spiralis]
LAEEDEVVHLIISLKKMVTTTRHKPYRVPLRVPMYNESSSVCLITKGDSESHVDKLKSFKIPQIKDVVTVLQLKKDYKAYEAKRQLISTHDLFLTDDRVVNSLPEILGVKFFKAKKTPVPVNLKAKNVYNEINKALSCTYFRQTTGTCTSVKIGMTTMSAPEITSNIETAMEAIVKCINKGWGNVQSVGIKTGTSLTLPIYN